MSKFQAVIDKIKEKKGLTTDEEVIYLLQMQPSFFEEARKRDVVPVIEVKRFCMEESVSYDEIVAGGDV